MPASAETFPSSVERGGASHHVVIETSSPIRPRGNTGGMCALAIGLFLALHTPTWVAMVFSKEDDNGENSSQISPSSILRFGSWWLLEFTPWFANALLSVFLGVLFLCMGAAILEDEAKASAKD
jgi:di/tricarboxylate transporter